MAEGLDGTVALVTGASSGIGEATAVELAARGARVVLAARRRDRLEGLASRLSTESLVIELDVTDEAAVVAAVEEAVERFGRLDTVVANAGVMLLGPAEEAPSQEWRRMVDLNVMGVLNTAHAALPHLLRAAESEPRRVADLVLVSSVAGRTTRPGSAVYSLTKHGIGAFAEGLRQEVTQRHVRVSLMEPGMVVTELPDHLRDGVRETALERMRSLERLESEDVADAIGYVVSRRRRVAINEMLIRPTEQV